MKKLIKKFKQWKKERKLSKELKSLKKECDKARKFTGKQHFVIPVDTRGVLSYTLMNNDIHKEYNKKAKKMGKRQIKYHELLSIAVYKTKGGTL